MSEATQQLFRESTLSDDNGLDKHMSGESITIVADKKQSVITWEFNTMGYDISFGIAKNEDPPKSRLEYLSPLLSYSPDKVHSGSLTINEPGTYLLVWDNSHSWLREKIISYKVTVRKLERSVDEISSFSKKVYNTLCNEEDQLLRTTDCIQAKVSEKEALEERLSLLLQQVQEEKESASSQEEMISKKKEETKAIESQREVLQQHADYLKCVAPFLVEGERIFSMLCGVDLLRLACVNHFLHDCVYQNGVWNRAFFQEEPDELTAVLQNEPLRVLYNLVNPSPSRKPTEVRKMDKVEEENKELIESRGPNELPEHTELPELPELPEHTELLEHKELLKNLGDQVVLETLDEEKRKKGDPLLQDLSLLYKITEKQGWYKNKQDQCYFIRFKDLSKKSMDILFPAISSTELDSLIRQTLKSTVLIPMPGTEAGKSGYYIDRFRRVSKWNVETVDSDSGPILKWTEVQI